MIGEIGKHLLESLLAYLINLAAGERSTAIAARREQDFNEALKNEEGLRKALASTDTIRDEIRGTCAELARNRARLDVSAREKSLWQLLSDVNFQADIAEWVMAGAIEEGIAVKGRVLQKMEFALAKDGVSPDHIVFLRTGYFEAIENAVFAHPVLAHWRHQMSLDYLREQVAVLRLRADEAVGRYSYAKQTAGLEHYCDMALDAWDIIDLSNLPEGDVHIATQQLLLRQLYVPLRVDGEPTRLDKKDVVVADLEKEHAVAEMEKKRELRREREAGHSIEVTPAEPVFIGSRSPVGERLDACRRLIVLGDPGGGKSTMLRWMATAYLFRLKSDAIFNQLPDTATLPAHPWIPVLIRCRDLGVIDLCRSFTDFLTQHLKKTKLLPEEADVMRAVILDRLAKGEVLLLVDGLDEIADLQVRMMFCQELEHTAARYPNSPIVVTSRIVGYRDMPYRIGSGFVHHIIAELNREDKDHFARRWIAVTEQKQSDAEKTKRVEEFIEALHSSNRIERLTGNPMLLTTLALVRRKVGKLPNRRTKLYAEAVSVLLNWNPRLYQAIDEDEAIPQLAYLAYEMCHRGVQRLTNEVVLDLLYKLRLDFPNVRAIRRREPDVFLKQLEERSSILIKSGAVWRDDRREEAVWEFHHLTFQEYLAARALLDGKYPNRDRSKSLAEQVAPLAGQIEETTKGYQRSGFEPDVRVPESWREVLRLLVADCKDDDVDEVMSAILNPAFGEDTGKTTRSRAVLAALCLTDEPNVGEATAHRILDCFILQLRKRDGGGFLETTASHAVTELSKCVWSGSLKERLMQEYLLRQPGDRSQLGALWARIVEHRTQE